MLNRRLSAAVLLTMGLAWPSAAQSPDQTASQTVVLPSLPGMKNQEIRLSGQDLAAGEATGPEIAYAARLVQWEEGRSVTVRLEDGTTRVVPVASNVIFPPDLRPGAMVTFLIRQISSGGYRVMGMTTGGAPMPQPAAATPPPAPVVPPAGGEEAAPPPMLTPPPSPPKGKAVRGATYLTIRGTLTAYESGTSVTVTEKNGKVRTIAIAKDAKVPGDLAVGENVSVRVPIQRPFDGKTTDQISRAAPPKTPIPSKFKDAQSPKY